jgi:ketol-acid reductoisomerase
MTHNNQGEIMQKQKVAIVGLGRVGSAFLDELLCLTRKGIKVAYAVEKNDTPGRKAAEAAGVKILTIDELITFGESIDIVFDLTGIAEVRKELREKLFSSNNRHTVIAPESIAHFLWSIMSDTPQPVIEGRKMGY